MVITIVGGIGLFLLGMLLMTDGLRALGGGRLRDALGRAAGSRGRALLSGAAVTAVVQSSSATTLATIGFVAAGILAFPQAVLVIFGANLGTTSTGWIVSLLGFKVQLTVIALPIVAAGAVAWLARPKAAAAGRALAGFGLIFVAIGTLQEGMSGLAESFDLGRIPSGAAAAVPILLAAGVAMTIIMQSSSAAVATTLAALHGGAISFEAAALLVIGQNLGTTVKALLASIGASVPARRTALAHVLFNGFTAVVALGALPAFLAVGRGFIAAEPEIALAVFHSGFNLAGVLLLLPVVGPFAALVERLLPERESSLTRNLDASVADIPAVAVEAARRSAVEVTAEILGLIEEEGKPGSPEAKQARSLERVEQALATSLRFLAGFRSPPGIEGHGRHLHVLHALDHLGRLTEAVAEAPEHAGTQQRSADLAAAAAALQSLVEAGQAWCRGEGGPVAGRAQEISRRLADLRRRHRAATLERTAAGGRHPQEAVAEIEAILWVDRVGYHIWRALAHLDVGAGEHGQPGTDAYPES